MLREDFATLQTTIDGMMSNLRYFNDRTTINIPTARNPNGEDRWLLDIHKKNFSPLKECYDKLDGGDLHLIIERHRAFKSVQASVSDANIKGINMTMEERIYSDILNLKSLFWAKEWYSVDDINETLKKVEGAGGSVFIPKTEVPNAGWFSVFKDPEGVFVGIFQGNE